MMTVVEIERSARRVLNRLLGRPGAPPVVAKTIESREMWATGRLLRHFGFTPEQYAGRTVVGVGDALGGPQTHGHGPFTLNYWLRRADV